MSLCLCLSVSLSLRLYVCMYFYMYACLPVSLSLCLSVCMHVSLSPCLSVSLSLRLYVCTYACISLCVCVCVHGRVYTHTLTHMCTHPHTPAKHERLALCLDTCFKTGRCPCVPLLRVLTHPPLTSPTRSPRVQRLQGLSTNPAFLWRNFQFKAACSSCE